MKPLFLYENYDGDTVIMDGEWSFLIIYKDGTIFKCSNLPSDDTFETHDTKLIITGMDDV
jgi:MoaA/NifB/PqqE/SkfB family radical SAM enzyme